MSNTRIYNIWRDMRHRCDCPNLKNFKHYGGRGITYAEEWSDFVTFYEWAKSNGYDESLTLDRINVDGNYCPENCRWVNKSIQNANRRNSGKTEYIGVCLRSNGSSYVTQIKSCGKIIFSFSSKSKNKCAIKRNEFITNNNLSYPINEIKPEYEDVRVYKNDKLYIAMDLKTGEEIIKDRLKDLASEIGVTRQFIGQCLRGIRISPKYKFMRITYELQKDICDEKVS